MSIAVFDLDGTLVDSAPDIHAIANAVLAEEGRGPITLAQTRAYIGHGAPAFVSQMMAGAGLVEDPAHHARLLAAFSARYLVTFERTRLFSGVAEALEALAEAGFQLGLCTNKPLAATQALLAHFGLADRFAAVVGGDSLPQRKPDPTPLLRTIVQLGAGTAVYIGDSEVDSATAQAARIPFALFTEGYRKAPVAAIPHDAEFADFSRLHEVVLELVAAKLL